MKAINTYTREYYTEKVLNAGEQYLIYLEDGTYEVEMYGAGGGKSSYTYEKAYGTNGGGAGAGFRGVVELNEGHYYAYAGKFLGSGKGGEGTIFGDAISCGGGKMRTAGYGKTHKGGDGGVITVNPNNVTVVSYEVMSNGDIGCFDDYNGNATWLSDKNRGKSLQDGTWTGYGAGQYGSSQPGKSGYFRITAVTGHLFIPKMNLQLYAHF